MDLFVARHAPLVTSTLSGFDCLVVRATLLPLVRKGGMFTFLCRAGKRLLDFGKFALETSKRVKADALESVEKLGRPLVYLQSPKISKEDRARRLLGEHPLARPGLICAFTALESCMTFESTPPATPASRNYSARRLENSRAARGFYGLVDQPAPGRSGGPA